jgi:hypothetical protein
MPYDIDSVGKMRLKNRNNNIFMVLLLAYWTMNFLSTRYRVLVPLTGLPKFSSKICFLRLVLRSSQPVTEISTRNLSGGKARPAHTANNLTAIYEPTV